MILGAWDFSSSFTRNAVIAEIEADRHAEATLEANILPCPSQTDNECILRALQSTREYQRAEANLNAQKDMAKWALAMVIISGAGTAVSLLGILFIADTLRATRKGNRINRRIGEAQSRAYLAAVSMKLERTTTTHFKVIVEINNTGITPAWDLRVSCVVRFEQINSGVVVNTFSVPSDENGVLTNHRREHPAAERREPHFNFVITEEQTTAISAGSWRIIGIVEIEYFDVFGKRHIAHPISYIDLQWVGTINHTSALTGCE